MLASGGLLRGASYERQKLVGRAGTAIVTGGRMGAGRCVEGVRRARTEVTRKLSRAHHEHGARHFGPRALGPTANGKVRGSPRELRRHDGPQAPEPCRAGGLAREKVAHGVRERIALER